MNDTWKYALDEEPITTIDCEDEIKNNIEVPFDDEPVDGCVYYCPEVAGWKKAYDELQEELKRKQRTIDKLLETVQLKQDTIDEIMRENGAYRTAIARWEKANVD